MCFAGLKIWFYDTKLSGEPCTHARHKKLYCDFRIFFDRYLIIKNNYVEVKQPLLQVQPSKWCHYLKIVCWTVLSWLVFNCNMLQLSYKKQRLQIFSCVILNESPTVCGGRGRRRKFRDPEAQMARVSKLSLFFKKIVLRKQVVIQVAIIQVHIWLISILV